MYASFRHSLNSRVSLSWIGRCEFFFTKIHVYHHDPVFSNLVFSWVLLLVSPGLCTSRDLLRVLSILFSYSLSIQHLHCFPSLYFTPNFFCLFFPGCWFIFLHPPLLWNFLSLFWKVLFCLYCLFVLPVLLSRCPLSLPSTPIFYDLFLPVLLSDFLWLSF